MEATLRQVFLTDSCTKTFLEIFQPVKATCITHMEVATLKEWLAYLAYLSVGKMLESALSQIRKCVNEAKSVAGNHWL